MITRAVDNDQVVIVGTCGHCGGPVVVPVVSRQVVASVRHLRRADLIRVHGLGAECLACDAAIEWPSPWGPMLGEGSW